MAFDGVTDEDIALLARQRDLTNETEAEHTARIFRENAVFAAQAICKLASHADDPRVQLSAATYVVDRTLGRIQDNPPAPDNDPYKKLIQEVVQYVGENAQ